MDGVGHFYLGGAGISRELPGPSQSSLTRGWEVAGLRAWDWGVGEELTSQGIIPFNIGKMGALVARSPLLGVIARLVGLKFCDSAIQN